MFVCGLENAEFISHPMMSLGSRLIKATRKNLSRRVGGVSLWARRLFV
jgi:hypothetical protein